MAISIRGNATAWAAVNATTQTVTLPTHVAGDMLIVRAGCKPYTATITCSTAGWEPVANQHDTGAVANAANLGSLSFRAFWKIATSAAETNPVVDWGTTAAPGAATAVVYQCAATETWLTPTGAGGSDNSAGTALSATMDSHISTTVDDMVDFYSMMRDDCTMTVPTFTQAGLTLGTVAEEPATALDSTLSNDIAADGGYRLVTAGTSSAAAVVTGTTDTNETGGAWTTRLRVILGAALTTVAGTGAVGSFGVPVAKVSFAELEVPDAGSVALTNVVGTGAVGSLAVAVVIGLSGVGATGSVGSLDASVEKAVSGVTATGSVGSFGVTVQKALSGLVSTGAVGNVSVPAPEAPLSGVEGTGGVGSLAVEVDKSVSGVGATGAVGSFGVTAQKALSGLAATGGIGSFGVPVAKVSFAELEIPASGAALTNVIGTGAVGSLGVTAQKALTGVEGTGAPGSLGVTVEKALSGVAGTGAVGDLSPTAATEVPLSGVEGTGAVGSFGKSVVKALSGVAGTGAVGSMTPPALGRVSWAEFEIPGNDIPLSGVTGTGAAGSLLAGVSSLALSGVSGTGAAGTLTPEAIIPNLGTITRLGLSGIGVPAYGEFDEAAPSADIFGVAATGSAGTLDVAVSKALSGVEGTGAVGSLSAQTTKAVSGVSATGGVGSLDVVVTKAVSGVAGTGAVGSVVPISGTVVPLSGVGGTGAVGSVDASLSIALSGVSGTGAAGDVAPPSASSPVYVIPGGVRKKNKARRLRILPDGRMAMATEEEVKALLRDYKQEEPVEQKKKKRARLKYDDADLRMMQEEEDIIYVMRELTRH